MNVEFLVKLITNVGIPLALLIAAVIALWRTWAIGRKNYEDELKRYRERLEARDDELRDIYKDAALKRLKELAGKGKRVKG